MLKLNAFILAITGWIPQVHRPFWLAETYPMQEGQYTVYIFLYAVLLASCILPPALWCGLVQRLCVITIDNLGSEASDNRNYMKLSFTLPSTYLPWAMHIIGICILLCVLKCSWHFKCLYLSTKDSHPPWFNPTLRQVFGQERGCDSLILPGPFSVQINSEWPKVLFSLHTVSSHLPHSTAPFLGR